MDAMKVGKWCLTSGMIARMLVRIMADLSSATTKYRCRRRALSLVSLSKEGGGDNIQVGCFDISNQRRYGNGLCSLPVC